MIYLQRISLNPLGNICPACLALLNTLWIPGTQPPEKLHPNCYCMYIIFESTTEIPPPPPPELPDAAKKILVYLVAWMLRQELDLVAFLEQFRQAAEDYNKTRDDYTPPEDETDALSLEDYLMSDNTRLQLTAGHIQLNTTNPKRYDVTFIEAGENLNDWTMPIQVLGESMAKFNGVPCLLNHASGWSHPDIEKWAGTHETPRLEGNAIKTTLRIADTEAGDRLERIFNAWLADEQAGLDTPPIGLSADLSLTWTPRDDWEQPRVCAEIVKVWSGDAVMFPAAGGQVERALNSIQSGGNTTMSNDTQPAAQAPPPAPPVLSPEATPATEQDDLREQVSALSTQVAQLTQLFTQNQEDDTVQDNGQAPLHSFNNGIDQLRLAINWLVGVEGAKIPDPFLRKLDQVYMLSTGDYEWRGVYQPDRVTLAAANASTLPGLIVDGMNKVILQVYDTLTAYRWYEMIVSVQPNDGSLQDMKWITFGGIGSLPNVPYGSEYTELAVDDTKEADSFAVYGGYVGITRQVLRNSDIARMQAIPRALAIASVRQRSSHISGIFTSNSGVGPTLDDDSVALFHTNTHANLLTTAYSIAAWKAARLECYKQTELGSSKRMGLWPKFWLGPADLYDQALIDFGYGAGTGGYPATSDNDVNPYAQGRPGDPRPIPIAVPDFTDTNDWGYLTDPLLQPVINISYANNPGGRAHPAPELFTVTSPLAGLMFTSDTLPIKCRDEYAYGVATYRGIGKRNVT